MEYFSIIFSRQTQAFGSREVRPGGEEGAKHYQWLIDKSLRLSNYILSAKRYNLFTLYSYSVHILFLYYLYRKLMKQPSSIVKLHIDFS